MYQLCSCCKPTLVFLVNLPPVDACNQKFQNRFGFAIMGQRGAGWTDTSQDAMDSAAREHQERMAAKTAYLKVQIILEKVEQSMHALVDV